MDAGKPLKVLVLGDSFGLPRPTKDGTAIEIRYEDTYPEQLRQLLTKKLGNDIALINRCRRYKTSFDIANEWSEDVYLTQPDYVVVQVGIVDCWPREGINWAPHPE